MTHLTTADHETSCFRSRADMFAFRRMSRWLSAHTYHILQLLTLFCLIYSLLRFSTLRTINNGNALAKVSLFGTKGVPKTGRVIKDDVGRLPALGWNTWEPFRCHINETVILAAAEKMVELGLKGVGYEYINIDDCWSLPSGRDPLTNRMVPDPIKFPNGIDGLAEKIHALGLKLGIYSSAGKVTCNTSPVYPASLGYEMIDAETWAEWGVDYLKYDDCGVPEEWKDDCNACVNDRDKGGPNGTCISTKNLCPPGYDYTKSKSAERYGRMRDALAVQNRTILFSLCNKGFAGVQQWGNSTGALWRSTRDINPHWPRILEIANENSFFMNSVNFYGHSDADMMEIGNGDLTLAERRSHMAFWVAMKSPLILGTNLEKLSDENVRLLKNEPLLAFHQDAVFGEPAKPWKWGTNADWTFNRSFPAEYWAGEYQNGTLVFMFNPLSETVEKTAIWAEIPGLKEDEYRVYDVWTGEDLGQYTAAISREVESHDMAVLLVKKEIY